MMENFKNMNKMIQEHKAENSKTRQRLEARLDDLGDKGRGRTEAIMQF